MIENVEIIYDGDCPVCKNINQYRKLKQAGANVKLTDARDLSSETLGEYLKSGINLNNDMIVIVDGEMHVGGSALRKLSEISDGHSMLAILVDAIFSRSSRPRTYRVFVELRRVLLKLLGRPEIQGM